MNYISLRLPSLSLYSFNFHVFFSHKKLCFPVMLAQYACESVHWSRCSRESWDHLGTIKPTEMKFKNNVIDFSIFIYTTQELNNKASWSCLLARRHEKSDHGLCKACQHFKVQCYLQLYKTALTRQRSAILITSFYQKGNKKKQEQTMRK